jgi:nucleotide-binding universal stress UspA family protein
MNPVLLATDGSPTARRATDTAIELARLLGTELVVASVWNIPSATVGFAPVPFPADVAKLAEKDAHAVAVTAAAHAKEQGVETRVCVLRGFPVEEIVLAAERFDPRFVVVGSHGWRTVKRALFGSVSTGVLHQATCPVLVVRGELRTSSTPARAQTSLPTSDATFLVVQPARRAAPRGFWTTARR